MLKQCGSCMHYLTCDEMEDFEKFHKKALKLSDEKEAKSGKFEANIICNEQMISNDLVAAN